MIYAGLTPEDPRVKAARDWAAQNYTVDENPGMGGQGHLLLPANARQDAAHPRRRHPHRRRRRRPRPWRADVTAKLVEVAERRRQLDQPRRPLVRGRPRRWSPATPLLALERRRPGRRGRRLRRRRRGSDAGPARSARRREDPARSPVGRRRGPRRVSLAEFHRRRDAGEFPNDGAQTELLDGLLRQKPVHRGLCTPGTYRRLLRSRIIRRYCQAGWDDAVPQDSVSARRE